MGFECPYIGMCGRYTVRDGIRFDGYRQIPAPVQSSVERQSQSSVS